MNNGIVIKKTLSVILFFIGAIVGYQISALVFPFIPDDIIAVANSTFYIPHKKFALAILGVSLFAGLGLTFVPTIMRLLNFVTEYLEEVSNNASWYEIASSLAGLTTGLIIANLLTAPFWTMSWGGYVASIVNIVFGLVFARLFLKYQRRNLKTSIFGSEKSAEPIIDETSRKILDSSVAIDARILDIAKTGFISGTIIIPNLVLLELQSIADSTDPTKRARGRRGLDTVKGLQNLTDYITVEIAADTFQSLQVTSVDSALLALAKKANAVVLTTDYNLSKLAQIQDVFVLNINDLGNAMKPQFLPGDLIEIDVLREGKEPNQGIGYLDDGTMLVVEEGEAWIGKRLEVAVTSILQTSAGRLVFGKYRREIRSEESR